MIRRYKSDWGEVGFDSILNDTLQYLWLRTNGPLLSSYLEDTDIRDLTVEHIRDMFEGSHGDSSAKRAVYLRVWDVDTKEVNGLWGNVDMELSRADDALVESLYQREQEMTCLVYVGEVTMQTIHQRSYMYRDHPLMHALWGNTPPTTLVVWQSVTDNHASIEIVKWMKFVVVELLGTYGRGLNRQPGGPGWTTGTGISTHGNDVLDLLREKLGLCDDESIEKFVVHLAFRRTVDELGEWFALFEDRGLNKADLKRMLRQFPRVLRYGVECIDSKLDWLQERLALDDEGLRKLVCHIPRVLGLSIDENIKSKLDWLQERMALDDEGLSKLVCRYPSVLSMSIEDNLEPKLDWLQERLGRNDTELSQLVCRFPSVLGYSIKENLEPTLDWLQERLALDDEGLSKLVRRFQHVLGLSIEENIKSRLDWFQERLGLNDTELSQLVCRFPHVLGMSIKENLEPTLIFYEGRLGVNAARTVILNNPRLLSASLENRLKPRLADAQQAGIATDAGTLTRMAQNTDDVWRALCIKSTLVQSKKTVSPL
jgi:hypothetical protein